MGPGTTLPAALALWGVASAVFLGLALPRLETPGAYYDELNKACAAFSWVGRPAPFFSKLHVLGKPLLVSKYNGAIKPHLYGPWMRLTGAPFTLRSWRVMGLGLAILGLALFTAGARRRLRPAALALFFALLVSDVHLLLSTRHDWGPVVVAFVIRLAFLGVWLAALARPGPPRPRNTLLLAALVGLAVYDKLSSVVLLGPFLLVLLLDPGRRPRRHWVAAVLGGLAGGLPLLAANVHWFASYGSFISLHEVHGTNPYEGETLLGVVRGLISLGAGAGSRRFILGDATPPWQEHVEAALVVALLLATLVFLARAGAARDRRPVILGLGAWGLTGAGLFLLPEVTREHHWILATPFHTLAFAVVAASPERRGPSRLALGLVLLLVLSRVPALVDVHGSLRSGHASRFWSQDLVRLGEAADARPDDHGFLCADWGVATQIFCFAQGRGGLVSEIYRTYRGPEALDGELVDSGKRVVHVVALDPPSPVLPAVTRRILGDLDRLPHWRRAPLAPDLAALSGLTIVTLERR